ncbi:glycosyltransferase family 2 protein [Pyrobaculum neutrophilum]|uniref:Glycosyl transferase family 2 n=1 Tax=Pyrobaculum neutrophilum (strain DSM 2338 / JCM 9278 / NBRC 100436 / V24Sta) TaxID=444157 RepID=B1YCB4_PYRNV|nr:glycosyltransferase [Pyrobaculum neutrophilum]ACB39427.1 glycosyl transferase family 2 [Pyrobaculum neutrophilum V24Sta]
MKIGVIISAYRRYHFLPQAIESVLKQTRKADEVVVVVDDAEKVKSYPVYIVESKAEKYGEMVAEGIRALDSDIIAFLEDDDIFHEDKLKIAEKAFKEGGTVALHHKQVYIDVNGNIIKDGSLVHSYEIGQPQVELTINKFNASKIFKKFPAIHHNPSSMLIKKEVFYEYKDLFVNIDLLLDFTLFITSLSLGRVKHIPDRLTFYRIGAGNSQLQNGDLTTMNKIICTLNRYSLDLDLLLKEIHDNNLRKLILKFYFSNAIPVYIFNTIFTCRRVYNISYYRLISRLLKGIFMNQYPTPRSFIALLLIPILGRRKVAHFALKYFLKSPK